MNCCQHIWENVANAPPPWTWQQCIGCGEIRERWGLDPTSAWHPVDQADADAWLDAAKSPLRQHLVFGPEPPPES